MPSFGYFMGEPIFSLTVLHGRASPGIGLASGGNHARDFDNDLPVCYAIAGGWAEFAETVLPSVGGANYVTRAITVCVSVVELALKLMLPLYFAVIVFEPEVSDEVL
jgi:hypothetical protein